MTAVLRVAPALTGEPGWEGLGGGPARVIVLDVEALPASIRSDRHVRLWALVRRQGHPIGQLDLPFVDGEVTGRELAESCDALRRDAAPQPPTSVWSALQEPLPSATVVIPTTFGREVLLRRCVDAIRELRYPWFDVVVVDNRSEGEIPGWLRAASRVRVVHEPTPGISAARNAGLAAATGEIVAFTDDDVIVDPLWLLALGARFTAHPEEAAVTGLVIPSELDTPAQALLESYYGGFGPRLYRPLTHRLDAALPGRRLPRPARVVELDDDGHLLRRFSLYALGALGAGANMAYRASVLRACGGFDLALGAGTPTCGGEDVVMLAGLVGRGHAVGFEPAALLRHTHRRDDAALRRQVEGYGVGFSASMIALAIDDPRHAASMAATLPRAGRSMGSAFARKLRARRAPREAGGGRSDTVSSLARLELRGVGRGPAAYLRSRRVARRTRPCD